MKIPPNSIVISFYENTPVLQRTTAADESSVIEIGDFSDVCTEAIYVIDFKKQCFHYVSDHDLFLCGHSKDEILELGYNFYSEIVHKDDLSKLAEMHREILKYLCCQDSGNDKIIYFSCTFRIKNYLQQNKQSEYSMVYQKLIPKFTDGEIRYGICLLTNSVIKNTGNLRCYYKNKSDFSEYSFATKRWKTSHIKYLTEREKTILRFVKQGKNLRKIADTMCVSYKTLQSITASIYEKFEVHTMEEAIIYATNHLLIFHPHSNEIHKHNGQCMHKKQCRTKLTPEILLRIQTKINNGQSINSIAKQEGVSNGAIHKAIKSKKLHKNT
jgi:DNA-binding CsgD family transcriptional regulator